MSLFTKKCGDWTIYLFMLIHSPVHYTFLVGLGNKLVTCCLSNNQLKANNKLKQHLLRNKTIITKKIHVDEDVASESKKRLMEEQVFRFSRLRV